MIRILKNTWLNKRFFLVFGLIIGLFALSFVVPFLFPISQTLLVLYLLIVGIDFFLLFHKNLRVHGERVLPKVLSLSDENPITIKLRNDAFIPLHIEIIDEIPVPFQLRNFSMQLTLEKGEEKTLKYHLRPLSRGAYHFGNINGYLKSGIGLIARRQVFECSTTVPVYPSIIQMKKYELMAFTQLSAFQGIKRLRRLGHSYEFEQIKNYVRGDDYRSVNWKATGRNHSLMVNQYQDERSQPVYCLIDKSRTMKMPFHDLSLLDYAINTSLTISNIALQKYDKAGLITFSEKVNTIIKADRKKNQLKYIIEALYNEQESKKEAHYEWLYKAIKQVAKVRSLLFLFSNVESHYALDRILPVLRRLNATHLLVFVFFENVEIKEYSREKAENLRDIYLKTIAQKYSLEKVGMVHKLQQYGIQTILTSPEDLSINTINKYLELKARGLI